MQPVEAPAQTPPPGEALPPIARWRGWLVPVAVFLGFWVLYGLTGAFEVTPYNAHTRLAHAILNGRFGLIDPPPYIETFQYNGLAYMGYGVGPTLVLLPFVAIWGLDLHQALVSAAMAAVSVALWWSIVGKLGFQGQARLWMTALFGVGSPFWFWAGQAGSTTNLMHVTTVFGLMLAIHASLGDRRGWLAGLGFGLAVLSRQPALLGFPFFVGMLWQDERPRRWRQLVGFGLGLGLMLAFGAYYNYARFGTPFDNGYARVNAALYHAFMPHGNFSFHYFAQHFQLYFLRLPARLDAFPWFDPTKDGFSLFISLPAVWCAFYANFRERLTWLALAAALAIQGLYLVYFWPGWVQFGCRYVVDYLPFAMLVIASGISRTLRAPLVVVTLLGAIVQVWGIFWWQLKGW